MHIYRNAVNTQRLHNVLMPETTVHDDMGYSLFATAECARYAESPVLVSSLHPQLSCWVFQVVGYKI